MKVFEIDGGNEVKTSPESSSVGVLYPGERMDLVVECFADPEVTGSLLSVTLDAEYVASEKGTECH